MCGAWQTLLFGVGHMHSGALNVSVFINGQLLCASCQCNCAPPSLPLLSWLAESVVTLVDDAVPVYGKTPQKVGDEKGHLVEVTRCLDDGSAGGYPGHPSGYRNSSYSKCCSDRRQMLRGKSFRRPSLRALHCCTQHCSWC